MFWQRKRGKFTIAYWMILFAFAFKFGFDVGNPGISIMAGFALIVYPLQTYWLYRRNRDRE